MSQPVVFQNFALVYKAGLNILTLKQTEREKQLVKFSILWKTVGNHTSCGSGAQSHLNLVVVELHLLLFLISDDETGRTANNDFERFPSRCVITNFHEWNVDSVGGGTEACLFCTLH